MADRTHQSFSIIVNDLNDESEDDSNDEENCDPLSKIETQTNLCRDALAPFDPKSVVGVSIFCIMYAEFWYDKGIHQCTLDESYVRRKYKYNRGITQAESFVLNYYIMLRHDVGLKSTNDVKPSMLNKKIDKCRKVLRTLEKRGKRAKVYATSVEKAENDRVIEYTISQIWNESNKGTMRSPPEQLVPELFRFCCINHPPKMLRGKWAVLKGISDLAKLDSYPENVLHLCQKRGDIRPKKRRARNNTPLITNYLPCRSQIEDVLVQPQPKKKRVAPTQGTSIYGSDYLDDDSDDDSESDSIDRRPSEDQSTSIELTPIDIKIEQVEEAFTQHDTEIGHSFQENDDIMNDEIENQDKTGRMSPLERNPVEQANNVGHFDEIFDEFREVTKEIIQHEEQLKKLNLQKEEIRIKWQESVDEILKCEEELMQLNAEEANIKVKLINSMK